MVSQGIVLRHIISEKGIEVDKAKSLDFQTVSPHKYQDCKAILGAYRLLQEVHHGLLKNCQAFVQTVGKRCQIYLGCRLPKEL